LVSGTLQASGNRIAVTLTADDLAHNRSLVNREFTGVRQDLLALEDQIFNQVVNTLTIQRTSDERARNALKPTEKFEAYDLYLQGQDILRGKRSLENARKALEKFEEARRIDAGFPQAYTGIADTYVRMWDEDHSLGLEGALGAAEEAKRLNDNLPEVHNSLGTIYADMGRTEGAIIELQRALQLAPNSDETWRRLGLALEKAGRRDQEVQALQKAVEINPYYPGNPYALGQTYFDLGRNREALEMFQQVVKLAPQNARGYASSGAVYYRLGEWDQCLASFQKAISLSPNASYYSSLGVAYFYLGRSREAGEAFETAVRKDPQSPEFLVNLADYYRWSNQTAKANATYDKAIEIALGRLGRNSKDSDAMGKAATAYAKEGKLDRAQQFIRSARSIDARDNDLMYREAVIYALAGQRSEAFASLKSALENGYSAIEAKLDPDLKILRDMPEFQSLVTASTAHK
jgi:tetratricopeptide (TPR) repeat protein